MTYVVVTGTDTAVEVISVVTGIDSQTQEVSVVERVENLNNIYTEIAPGSAPLFVGPTTPTDDGPYLWVQTGLGGGSGLTLWVEDGL